MSGAREVFLHRELGEGHVTLSAWIEPGKAEIDVGVALCSPTDNFSRPIGRAIASGRRAASEDRSTAQRFTVEPSGTGGSGGLLEEIETCFYAWFVSEYENHCRDWLRAAADTMRRREAYGVPLSLHKRAQ